MANLENEKIISVENVSYSYEEKKIKALSDVSFSVEKGEYIAILGLNGSGKSTLARIICNFLEPDEGEVKINTDSKVPYGIVFQNPKSQIIAEIVNRDISFGPKNLGCPEEKTKQITDRTLSLLDLEEKKYAKTIQLSAGQKQKLVLGGIISLSPEILVLDEAISMVDPETRSSFLDFIDKYNAEGHTVISVTHDYSEAKRAKRIIALDDGKICFDGKFSDLGRKVPLFFTQMPLKRDFYSTEEISLKLENISFSYGNEKILDNISLNFEAGSLNAVMGKSGEGKSTLFEICTGILKADEGSIHACSNPSLSVQESESALFEEFAADDVAFGPKNMGKTGKILKSCVKNAMNIVGLDFATFADRKVMSLSGGQKRKLALAGTIALDSEIIFFDEPTAGLDPQSRHQIIEILQKLADDGKTIIFSTHRKDEAECADRIIVLKDGAIASDSSTRKLSQHKEDFIEIKQIQKAQVLNSVKEWSFGLYQKKDSFMHRLSPKTKTAIFFILLVTGIALQNIPLLVGLIVIESYFVLLSRYSFKTLFSTTLKVIPWILFFFVFQVILIDAKQNDIIYWQWKFINITKAKCLLGVKTLLHFIAALLPLSVYLFSAEESEILDGITELLSPLKKIHFPVKHVVMIINIVFRFIPVLMEESSVIIKAQLCRNPKELEKKAAGKTSFFQKVAVIFPIFIPLIIQTLKRASDFADALETRYYN